jgi:hypothetical protein
MMETENVVQNSTGPQKHEPDCILTVRARRLLFFSARGKEVSVLKGDKVIDKASTDSRGEACFKLAPGEYVVTMGDRRIPIDIKQHATLRM